MDKLLVPVDFSATAEEALRYAVDWPCAAGRQVVLLHVVDPVDIAELGLVGLAEYEPRMADELRAEAERRLAGLARRHAREGLALTTRVAVDRPWRGIIRTAIEERVAAIVMGAHGRGALAETLLGATTEKVVRKAPMTVVVHKPRAVRERLLRHWQALEAG